MTKYILPIILFFYSLSLCAQSMPKFTLIQSSGQLKIANSEWTDKEGWTHYYNDSNNELLLSIHTGDNNTLSVQQGLSVTSGLLGSYGTNAQNLSTADYVEDTHSWFVMNRYWQIKNAPSIDTTLSVRFYFTQKDIDDVDRSIAPMEEKAKKPADLEFFTISNITSHPFSESIIKNGGKYTLYYAPGRAAPSWKQGKFQGLNYAEIQIFDLNISGGGGRYIKPFDGRFTVSGFVKTREGEPLPNVEILEKDKVVAVSDANGFYEVMGLIKNENYTFTPRKRDESTIGVSVLDMVFLNRGLKKSKLLKDPWLQLVADANYSKYLTASDIGKMRDAILHQDTTFVNNGAWQFVTKGFEFPSYGDPFKTDIPQSVTIRKIQEDVNNQNFTGLKTGDIVHPKDFPNSPPLDINPIFRLEDVISCGAGDTLSIPLTVKEFRRVMGFQFSLKWDKKILQFIGASDFQLSGLDENSFGFRYKNDGMLGMAWTTISQRGTSIKDGTPICLLKFLVNGKNGDMSRITFSDYPSPIQILRDNFSSANTLLSNGSVTIDNQSPIQVVSTNINNISCNGDKNGSIKLELKGGSGEYTYKWNTNSTNASLSSLSGGNYNVTVYDPKHCPLVSEDFVITEPQELRMSGSQVFPITCPGAKDGAIEVRVTGGTEPYAFQWSNNANTQNIKKLTNGTYDLTITDANGCEDFASFTIQNLGKVLVGISLSDETADSKSDGALRINRVIGGTSPYTYKWSNGEKGEKITNLVAGDYEVTINDSEGCKNKLTFTVGNNNGQITTNEVSISIPPDPIIGGEPAYVNIQSPMNQNVGFKMFDLKSKQIKNENIAVLRGTNRHFFNAPLEKGTYLLQFLPSTGGVQSVRIAIQ